MSASPAKLRAVWVIIAIVVGLPVLYAIWQVLLLSIEAARDDVARGRLKQIGLALHHYHDLHNSFPPAYTLGPDGKPWHSWRVLILPQLGEQKLYEQYRFDEPWNGPNNSKLLTQNPSTYASHRLKNKKLGATPFLGVVSRRTMWPAHFSTNLQDFTDGTSTTVMLIEDVSSDVLWSEPRELRERDALAQLQPGRASSSRSGRDAILVLMADGAVRNLSRQINRDLFVSLLTPKHAAFMVGDGWPRDDDGPRSAPNPVDINQFPGTQVLTVPDTQLDTRKSVLYCATNQLAWDLLRPEPGLAVRVTKGASATTDALNRRPFPVNALAPECYFTGAEGLGSQLSSGLETQLRKKFPDARIEMLPAPAQTPGVRILAYLQKSMPFPDVFEKFPDPMPFGDQEHVKSFGWPAAFGEGAEMHVLKQTVHVMDYVSPTEFIVLLNTDSPQHDEIILARIDPGESLQATWETTVERMKTPRAAKVIPELRAMDHLQIPMLSVGVISRPQELLGILIPTPTSPDRTIFDIRQVIRLRLDESGAELIADTQSVIGENGDGPLHVNVNLRDPRRMVFDKPFLIAIREKDADAPFLLAWIGNADLMEKQSGASAK